MNALYQIIYQSLYFVASLHNIGVSLLYIYSVMYHVNNLARSVRLTKNAFTLIPLS